MGCEQCDSFSRIIIDLKYSERISISLERDRKQKKIDKENFNNVWSIGSIEQKLSCYGCVKLRVLASRKMLKGRSKMNKPDLIKNLVPMISVGDLPIKC